MVIAVVICACFASAQQISPTDTEKLAIRHLLQAQVDAWNLRDLEGFMNGYWRSPDLTFFSGANATEGWQTTLDRYRRRYQSEGKEMGKLDFYDLYVDLLGTDAAFVRGHWHLAKKSGKEEGGLFTLVLKKFPEGWRIVHDHTS
jgi:ketosteroid isomerase-like protein